MTPLRTRPALRFVRRTLALTASIAFILAGLPAATDATAQDTVTGAFQGTVTSSDTGEPVAGASVEIVHRETGQTYAKTSDALGRWYQGLLHPGLYTIRVSAPGFQTKEVAQRLYIAKANEAIPVPVTLDPLPTVGVATPTPPTASTPAASPTPSAGGTPTPGPTPAQPATVSVITQEETDVRARRSTTDARQGGSFTEEEVSTLPLGSSTFTRTFDELALLLPGVAPPPQTLGSVAGPGVGAGVGSAGQFSVNGLRSRGNNFTVDGSDNNDEDIGVRRQGFVALNSQPVESVREYQAITLLAPAQFGRNIGAQVNAVSKSGGAETHGTLYGFFNSSQLNARNPFDTANGNATVALTGAGGRPVIVADDVRLTDAATFQFTPVNPRPLTVTNQSGGEDSFTLAQFGLAFGGPLHLPRRAGGASMFYFVSGEGYSQNATREESFAVPRLGQRGVFGAGETGLFEDPFTRLPDGQRPPVPYVPTTSGGDAIFSLFPFPNNPQGVYGPNTFTQILPNGAKGKIASGKFDANFRAFDRHHSLTNRYNFTDDRRDIPVVGGALFSSLRAHVRTQNNSVFLNSELSGPDSTKQIFNQVRLSYGRTRLFFEELRDQTFQLPNTMLPGEPFLLNARLLENFTVPRPEGSRFGPNTGPILYLATPGETTQNSVHLGPTGLVNRLGAVGQVNIAGFSPVGVDVFNFPQRRVNNTYQLADELSVHAGNHTWVFGADFRRSELNSTLPRNSRPLITFAGAAEVDPDTFELTGGLVRPETLAAASAPTGVFQTLALRGEQPIGLRYYQLNFYGQDTWRLRRNLLLSFGLRYEYNTPPREMNRRIENSFSDPLLRFVPGLQRFIGDRDQIFSPDRNNFAPRVSLAYSPDLFNRPDRASVIRVGYGRFYDQILGAVVSQSRNVYPDYLTVNFGGGGANLVGFDERGNRRCPQFLATACQFELLLPANPIPNLSDPRREAAVRLVRPGTLNQLNPNLRFEDFVRLVNEIIRGGGIAPPTSGFGATLPSRRMDTPSADHFTASFEQQFGTNLAVSVAYVGTRGRNLLRFTTPNLGPNTFVVLAGLGADPSLGGFGITVEPAFFGFTLPPGSRLGEDRFVGGRPFPTAGAVFQFETTARSWYDSVQAQLRTRLGRGFQGQLSYTYGKAIDDVSDVFDLAGASALPQDSFDLDAERGFANFDVRHRVAYHFIYDLPFFADRSRLVRALLGGFQIAGTGSYHTGQPFTVNSIFDVNLDGNLTDRLDTTEGIVATGDRRRPYALTVEPRQVLARIGRNGSVARNTFRASSFFSADLAVVKHFRFAETQSFTLRVDVFNLTNRANYGIPVRFLEAPGFGESTNTVSPARRVQFSLKYNF